MIGFFKTTNYSFEGKKENEGVILLLHRHKLMIATKLAIIGILAILPVIFRKYIPSMDDLLSAEGAGFFIVALYYMLIWSYGIKNVTLYILDSWIVTDKRIINNTQHNFFRRTVSELELSRIQDISVKIHGFLPTVLDFGDLEVQTASAVNKFIFEDIPDPHGVKDKIMELVRKTRTVV